MIFDYVIFIYIYTCIQGDLTPSVRSPCIHVYIYTYMCVYVCTCKYPWRQLRSLVSAIDGLPAGSLVTLSVCVCICVIRYIVATIVSP